MVLPASLTRLLFVFRFGWRRFACRRARGRLRCDSSCGFRGGFGCRPRGGFGGGPRGGPVRRGVRRGGRTLRGVLRRGGLALAFRAFAGLALCGVALGARVLVGGGASLWVRLALRFGLRFRFGLLVPLG